MTESGTESKGSHQLLHPAHWKRARGYANGMACEGKMVFVGGQIGWNQEQIFTTDDFVEQVAQSLRNIKEVLAEADARPEHVARMTWFVLDRQEYLARLRDLGVVYRAVFGNHYPAMTMVQVSALVEDRAKVEIEATAVIP